MKEKPNIKEALMPPFQAIGEPGWAERLRQVLLDYDTSLPEPAPYESIEAREQALGIRLPRALRAFYMEFGPVDFDGFELFSIDYIKPLDNVWFRDFLTNGDQARLHGLLGIADSGCDNYIAIDPVTGKCYLCSHDPAGIFEESDSFDDLIRKAVIDLSWGYYGWPDPEVERLATELRRELFGEASVSQLD
jgi:SMI1 / KNR4 family (SUKH-1)